MCVTTGGEKGKEREWPVVGLVIPGMLKLQLDDIACDAHVHLTARSLCLHIEKSNSAGCDSLY